MPETREFDESHQRSDAVTPIRRQVPVPLPGATVDVHRLTPATLAEVQRLAGNRAVSDALGQHRDDGRARREPATPAVQRDTTPAKSGLGGMRVAAKGDITLSEPDDLAKYFKDVGFDAWYLTPKKVSFTYDGYLDQSEPGRADSRGGVQFGALKNVGLKFDDKLREEKGKLLGTDAKIGLKGGFELLGGKTGVSATIYGQFGFVYAEGKVFAGVKYDKEDKAPELVAGSLSVSGAGAGETRPFHLGDAVYKFAGKLGVAVELEVNWKRISETLFQDVLPVAAEAAAVAGPPLLFAAITGLAIVQAGDKGELYSGLVGYALDARRAAAVSYLIMSGAGDGLTATGPISAAAKASAEAELAKAAEASQLSVDSLKELLRAAAPERKPVRYEEFKNQAVAALDAKAQESIIEWRKGHRFSAFWTQLPDQLAEARRHYGPILDAELSLRDVQNAPVL